MKPLSVALLVVAAAVGGGVFMKWEIARETAAVPREATPVAQAPVKMPEFDPSTTAETELAATPEAKAQAAPKPAQAHQTRNARPAHVTRAIPVTHVTQVIRVPRAPVIKPPPPVAVKPATEQIARVQAPVAAPIATPVAEPEPAHTPEPAVVAESEPEPEPAPLAPHRVTLQPGTLLYIRTVEALSSDRNAVGDTFSGTLNHPLIVDGMVIAERGARAEGHIIRAQRAGRVQGVSSLAIQLNRITTSDGQHVAVDTEPYGKQGASSTRDDAMKVGGGAGLGAAIGAIAGGGKGAGIGAAVGGAAGVGSVLLTGGKPVAIPSESVIPFRVRNSVTITERVTSARN